MKFEADYCGRKVEVSEMGFDRDTRTIYLEVDGKRVGAKVDQVSQIRVARVLDQKVDTNDPAAIVGGLLFMMENMADEAGFRQDKKVPGMDEQDLLKLKQILDFYETIEY